MVILSPTEAECIAILELCTDKINSGFFGHQNQKPIILHCDNIGAIYLGHNTKLLQNKEYGHEALFFERLC